MPIPAIAVAGLLAFGILAKHTPSNLPTSGPDPASNYDGNSQPPLISAAPGAVMQPETAYSLIQSGAISQVMQGAMISKWFSWQEFFASSELTTQASKQRVPLRCYQNAVIHAHNLDRVRDAYGQPMRIISWMRLSSKTSHGDGAGTDFGGDYTEFNAMFRAFMLAGWSGGIGKSITPNDPPRLHADSWQSPKRKPHDAWIYVAGGWQSGGGSAAALLRLKHSAGIA